MEEALRRSAAHVLVGDVEAPELDDTTRHHLQRVLRLRAGEAVTVTDGKGSWRGCAFTGGNIESSSEVRLLERPQPTVTVAVSAPKGERLDWLVSKCTEVGVDRLVLVDAERSVVRWTGDRAERQLARLRRLAVEASLQSRRVWLPEISGPVPAVDVLPTVPAAEPGGRRLTATDTALAIGPEGGWSAKELEVAAGTVSLGDTVLRVETAAVVATAAMVTAR